VEKDDRASRTDPVELSAIDRGAGPPVALVHGGVFHSGPAWARNIGPIAEAGYRVLAVDRRGHGRSPGGDIDRIPVHLHSDDLRLTLELRGAPQAHVVGVSYGALVCLEFALSWPERTLSMTLLEPPLFTWLAGDPEYHVWFERFVEVERSARGGAPLEEWMPTWLRLMDGNMAEEIVPGTPIWSFVESHAGLVFKEEAGWEYDPDAARLDSLEPPSMVLNGELSEPPMQVIGERLAERIGARHHAVRGGGHDAHAKAPAAFNRLLIDFLAGQP
jgi:3-oxoadipate enol-lactonase